MHKYFVTKSEQITPSTLHLTLHRDQTSNDGHIAFQPGQYAAISFRRHGRPTPARCFSIVSSPTETEILRFSMRTKGRFTRALAALQEGDEVKVRGPYGGFTFNAERDTDTVFLAGGIGITPFMSMIRFATATRLHNKITLVYSNQSQDDVPFMHELLALERQNPNLRVIFVISNGPTSKIQSRNIVIGRLDEPLLEKVTGGNYFNRTFFVCGPPPFMRAMVKILKEKRVPSHNLITEAFSQGPNRQTGKIYSWPFNMYLFSALGVVIGSLVIMVSDIMKILPPSIFNPSNLIRQDKLTNSRQSDLDTLVNELSDQQNDAPESSGVKQAKEDNKNTSQQTQAQTQTQSQAQTQTSTSTPTPSTTTPPTPKCTTTQSGITTCL